jgi:hypothetical protein
MEQNPYESPRECGYDPPRVRSRWWDFVACVGTALVIHAVLQAAGQAYRISGLDWSRQFKTLGQIFVVIALLAYAILFALGWWRKRRTRPHQFK